MIQTKTTEKGLVTYGLLSTYLLPKETNGLLIGMVIFLRCFKGAKVVYLPAQFSVAIYVSFEAVKQQ